MAGKAAIRIFHYRGKRIENDPRTNLLKPPQTITGPVIQQISDAVNAVVRELSSGVQMGPHGFEIVQQYPLRVIREAITNAVIHRDYHLPADIHIRLFSDRIEIESPGLLPGPVTTSNIRHIGTFNRNPILINQLREFPEPPNLDAGEGVPMMFDTMRTSGLYEPLYSTRPQTSRDAVVVYLLNEFRPSTWDQVSKCIDSRGPIGNAEVREILEVDILTASKQIKKWVEQGLLYVTNPAAGTRFRKYGKPDSKPDRTLFSITKR